MHSIAMLMFMMVIATGLSAATELVPAAAGAANQNQSVVMDWGSILDDGQERSAIYDASRLNAFGIPTQIVTEAVALDQTQADARADELRVGHGIESAPGADDGLLVYASVDRWDQRRVVMSISVGSRTLPRNGLDAGKMEAIQADIMTHQLEEGHPARAIVYSLREMIYLEQYVPPPQSPLTGWRADARTGVDIVAPALAIAGGAWLILDLRRRPAAPATPWRLLAAGGILALALVGLAIASRSSIGALSAILMGGAVLWRSVQIDRQSAERRGRKLVASPRPPGARMAPRQ